MTHYISKNPATGDVAATYPEVDDGGLDNLVAASHQAQSQWAGASATRRGEILHRVATMHRERREELAMILTTEMGKPIVQARGEVDLVASIYEYYANHLEEFLSDQPLTIAGAGAAVVRAEPLGVLLGVMPWNFPYYQVARFAAPNLALGNAVVVKHARNCPRAALAIEEVLREAGIPEGVYANAFISTRHVDQLIGDERIAGVSLTGSEKAGEAIGAAAGRHLKRSVLELGGSDPFIVLEDADITEAARTAARARIYNSGQACTASKRFLVHDAVYDEFVRQFVSEMEKYVPTDPTSEDSLMGPLSSEHAALELDELVADAIGHGAELLLGGRSSSESSAFYPSTVLANVPSGARAFHEELFGPVAVVYRGDSDDELVRLANDSVYGLGGAVFSEDRERARAIADRVDTGMIAINGVIRSSPDLPFGGIKRSGVGRELGRDGFLAFANQKLIREAAAPQ